MVNFGLIGRKLGHSFSKSFFENKFRDLGLHGYHYHNYELEDIRQLPGLLAITEQLRGLNVTIPYKQSVVPYLDELDPEAKQIGAVNCIHIVDGKLKGYNTDAYGFAQSIKPFLASHHRRALVLGTGGAAKAVAFSIRKLGMEVFFITSSPAKKNKETFLYSDVNEIMMQAFGLIVNATPLGKSPDEKLCPPLPYGHFTPDHLAYDLNYNPAETEFMKQARTRGAVVMNGLSMLQLQAEKSWEIWNSASTS